MRTALLSVMFLCLTGCWKEIHEAAAPPVDPPRDQVAVASPASVR